MKTLITNLSLKAIVLTCICFFVTNASNGQLLCYAQFTQQPGTTVNSVHFTSSANSSPLMIYSWTFGDGSTSNAANPVHTYAPGNYLACLTVTLPSTNGTILCTATFCDSVHVGSTAPACNANFTHTPASNTFSTINFFSALNPAGTTYSWTFGDGDTSTNPNPHHTYAPGNYLACLTVNYGTVGSIICTATFCDSVHVGNTTVTCNAHFTQQGGATVNGVYFVSSPNPTGAIYSWTFGDGAISSQQNPFHSYAPGNYLACLTVTVLSPLTGGIICSDTYCDSVHVSPNTVSCNAHFTYSQVSLANGVLFTSSLNPAGATYSWSFGDGGTSTNPNPTHTYAPGHYLACLTVAIPSSNGSILCTATFCDSIHIGPTTVSCSAIFTHQATSAGEHFTSAANPPGAIYSWTFGDGGTSNLPNPTHLYAPGNYLVCLTVIVSSNPANPACTSTYCDSIHIGINAANCTANFNYHHTPAALTYSFTNLSSPNATGYLWHFGDATTSTQANPVHHYTAAGPYQVCVTMFDSVHHCSKTNCKNIQATVVNMANNYVVNAARSAGTQNIRPDKLTALVYPNPTSANAIVHIENANSSARFKLFDNTGRLVLQKDKLSNGDFELNTAEISPGIYYYRITDETNSSVSGKLMIQK